MAGAADSRPLTSLGLLRERATASPSGVATYHRDRTGVWTASTWASTWRDVERAANAFRRLGLLKGDRVAIMARTCREWQIAEFAAGLVGAVVVGIDAHGTAQQAEFILATTRAVGIVAEDGQTLSKLAPATVAQFRFVLLFRPSERDAAAGDAWTVAIATERDAPAAFATLPEPDDPAVLIFTSGTTGEPKGIQYSHRQVMLAAWAMVDAYRSLANGRLVCWLPMAALFQRMMNLVGFGNGSVTYFVEDPREIVASLREIKPTTLTSVPRFYEKVYEGIGEQLRRQKPWQRRLAERALRIGERRMLVERDGRQPGPMLAIEHAMLDRLVLRRIRAALGGEVKCLISGSAAMPTWLIDFYFSLGLPLLEAYGVTENPIPVAGNLPELFRPGSVGRPFPGNEVRLSSESEVLVKGPALFGGYEGDADNRGVFTHDGYYRTGDCGRFDADGYLYLTGRLSELIKISTGRKVAPAAIEAVYGQSRYIDQVVVVGSNRPYLTALIVPSQAALDVGAERARALITDDVTALGGSLAAYERIRAFELLPGPLSIERGELTPTLKLRRARIESTYVSLIERMYRPHATEVATAS